MKAEPTEARALAFLRHPLVVLASIGGGVAIAVLAPAAGAALRPAGQIYLFLLQMSVLPIVVLASMCGVASLVTDRSALRLAGRTLLVMAIFLLAAALLGLGVALLVEPGSRMGPADMAALSKLLRSSPQGADVSVSLTEPPVTRTRDSVLDLIASLVPRNIFASLTAGTVLQVLLFSLLVGVALGLLRDKPRAFILGIAQNALAGFTTVNRWLIYLLPLGAACLVSSQVASADTSLLPALADFLITLVGCLAGGSLLLLIVLWRSCGSLRRAIHALVEPLSTAFITASSFIALPYSLRALEDRLGLRSDRVQATLPVAAALARHGTLLVFVLAAFSVANLNGASFSAGEYGTLLLFAAAAAIASSGSSAVASLGMVSAVFAPLGLPVETALVIFGAGSLVMGPVLAAFEAHSAIAASALIARAPERARVREPRLRLLPIRVTILALLAALIVLTGGVSIGVMYSGQRRNIAYLADEMIGQISQRIVQRTVNYLSPAERGVENLRYLLEARVLDPADRSALVPAMRNIVERNPEFASVYFGDTSGTFTMVKRMPDGTLSLRLIDRTPTEVRVDWQHSNRDWESSFPDSVETPEQGYDPRTRGWFKSAAASGARIWSDVYLFASDNMLGLSAAVPIYGSAASGERVLRGVAAVDIGLAELSYFLDSLDIGGAGIAYILNEKEQLVALSMPRGSDLSSLFGGRTPTGSAASTANLVHAGEAMEALVRQSYLDYVRRQRGSASFSFRVERQGYITAFTSFPEETPFRWKIGVVIPEAEIYGFVNETSRIVLGAALLIILASIGIGMNFSRAITTPLHRLSLEMERIRNFDLSSHEQVSSGITEIHTMAESFSNMKHGLSAFSKYVPSKLVAELIRLGEEPRIGGQRRSLTIFFSDIADFTSVSERLEPEKLVDEMAVYLGALGNAIMRNRGTVDKYIGDAIMALWNAPGEVPDHEVQACLAALECQEVLAELRRREGAGGAVSEMSVFTNRTRMGIHTGEVIVGNMGSEERLSYTAVGDSVNLASRLEGLNKFYGTTMLVSEATYARAKRAVAARLVDRVAVKGRSGGIEIYELMGRRDRLGTSELRFIEAATAGVRRYLDGDFEGALAMTRQVLAMRGEDSVSRIIIERCEQYLLEPPPKDWKGVYVHHAK